MFVVNHDEAKGNRLENGVYEMIIKKPEVDYAKSGTKFMSIPMVVRNDINQECKNLNYWHRVWTKKDTGEFITFQMQQLAKAINIPNGTQFSSEIDFFNVLEGQPLRVKIKLNDNGYPEAEEMDKTKYPTVNHVWKMEGSQEIKLNDEDLPF